MQKRNLHHELREAEANELRKKTKVEAKATARCRHHIRQKVIQSHAVLANLKNSEKNKKNMLFTHFHSERLYQQNLEMAFLKKENIVKKRVKQFAPDAKLAKKKLWGRAQYERKQLEKELDELFAKESGPVKVRNIFVNQDNDHLYDVKFYPRGEYDLENIDIDDDKNDKKNENDQALIEKYLQHISRMAKIAKQEHLKHNFYNNNTKQQRKLKKQQRQQSDIPEAPSLEPTLPLRMRPHKANDITRLAFHEFSFYPYKERGPLSVSSFNLFLQKIHKLAKTHPENLHWFLGTFPVQDAKNNLFNVGVYVQCGPKPKITLSTKATPYSEDPYYTNTTNVNCFNKAKIAVLYNIVEKHIKDIKIYLHYVDAEDKALLIQAVQSLNEFCKNNESFGPAVEMREALLKFKTQIDTDDFTDEDKNTFSKKFTALCEKFETYQENHDQKICDQFDEKFSSATFAMLNQVVAGVNAKFTKVVECATAGGVKFITTIDICLDHHKGIAKKSLELKSTEKMKINKLMEPRISHLLSSNNITLTETSTVSPLLEQVDPKHEAMHHYSEEKKEFIQKSFEKSKLVSQTHFGGRARLTFYKPVELQKLSNNIHHNEFGRFLIELKTLRKRYPQGRGLYDKFIYLHILNYCIEKIKAIPNYQNNQENVQLLNAVKEGIKILDAKKQLSLKDLNKIFSCLSVIIYNKLSPLQSQAEMIKSLLVKEMREQTNRNEQPTSTRESRRLMVSWR